MFKKYEVSWLGSLRENPAGSVMLVSDHEAYRKDVNEVFEINLLTELEEAEMRWIAEVEKLETELASKVKLINTYRVFLGIVIICEAINIAKELLV